MAYIFCDHARLRMQRRGITDDQVKETIEQPELKWPDKKIKGRHIHVRTYGQRQLKVVWTPNNHDALVVTAVWL